MILIDYVRCWWHISQEDVKALVGENWEPCPRTKNPRWQQGVQLVGVFGRVQVWQTPDGPVCCLEGNPLQVVSGQNLWYRGPLPRLVRAWQRRIREEISAFPRIPKEARVTRLDVAVNCVLPEQVYVQTLELLSEFPLLRHRGSQVVHRWGQSLILPFPDAGSFMLYDKNLELTERTGAGVKVPAGYKMVRAELRSFKEQLRAVGITRLQDIRKESCVDLYLWVLFHTRIWSVLRGEDTGYYSDGFDLVADSSLSELFGFWRRQKSLFLTPELWAYEHEEEG